MTAALAPARLYTPTKYVTTPTPKHIDYYFENEADHRTLRVACNCDLWEGQTLAFSRGTHRYLACYEHAPIYYASPLASCDTCGTKALLYYYDDDGSTHNLCRQHATRYTTNDLALIANLIHYDDESEWFAKTWDLTLGWDSNAQNKLMHGFDTPDKSRDGIEQALAYPVVAPFAQNAFTDAYFVHSSHAMPELPDKSMHACITSPPYFGHRDYDEDGQIGMEATLEDFLANLVYVFREVNRVLRDDGNAWIVIGDSYASKWACNRGKGHKIGANAPTKAQRHNRLAGAIDFQEQDLMMVPQRLAELLQRDGWLIRQLITWHKPHARPEPPSKLRRTNVNTETIIHLAKSRRSYFDADVLAAIGRSGSVWSIDPVRETHGHSAAYPPELVASALLPSVPLGGYVLDPFAGSGTTAIVARAFGRRHVNYDISQHCANITRHRLASAPLLDTDLPTAFAAHFDSSTLPPRLF